MSLLRPRCLLLPTCSSPPQAISLPDSPVASLPGRPLFLCPLQALPPLAHPGAAQCPGADTHLPHPTHTTSATSLVLQTPYPNSPSCTLAFQEDTESSLLVLFPFPHHPDFGLPRVHSCFVLSHPSPDTHPYHLELTYFPPAFGPLESYPSFLTLLQPHPPGTFPGLHCAGNLATGKGPETSTP